MYKEIYLDIGHAGHQSNPWERGAASGGFYESDLALEYAIIARNLFFNAGYKVFLLTYGNFSDRIQWANAHCNVPQALYISCHLNAVKGGGGNYPLVLHYHDAGKNTREVAKYLAKSFLDNLSDQNTNPGFKFPDPSFAPNGVKEIQAGESGEGCLKGTRMSAVIVEPGFISNKNFLQIAVKQPEMIALAIFEGVEKFNIAINLEV